VAGDEAGELKIAGALAMPATGVLGSAALIACDTV